jgi:hypothetical protein
LIDKARQWQHYRRNGRWVAGTFTITRPALANERVQINAGRQVVLKLKTAWSDGATHIVMSPLEFMQRLAALALSNDRFQALNLAERMRELVRMRVYAT